MHPLPVGRFIIETESKVFTDRLREQFRNIIDPAASFLLKIGLTPNLVTLLGLAGHTAAAILAAYGRFTWVGVILLVMAPMDALDGAMARKRGITGHFGAFFDSVIDRYSELVLYGGLVIYFTLHGNILGCILAYLSMTGSLMVSYTRARAEGLGFNAKIGLLSRVERYLILIPSLLFQFVLVGLWILAIFTNITTVQRILSVWKQASQAGTGNRL